MKPKIACSAISKPAVPIRPTQPDWVALDFVVPGLGIRCVDTNPWVTGAETCELAMALDALGDHDRALTLLRDMQHLLGPEPNESGARGLASYARALDWLLASDHLGEGLA